MKNLKYQERGKVGIISLNRPETRNALSLELLQELEDLIRKISEERLVRVVVIRGEGRAFSSGHDLKEILDRHPIEVEKLFNQCYRAMLAIRDAPQPYIAMVQGVATAAGCQLVAACDMAVAAKSALFATPGVKIGLFCYTPIAFVSRAVGRKKAFEMGFTGEFITADEALQFGLVNRVVEDEKLEEETMKLAESVARYSLNVLESGKRFFYKQLFMEDFQALAFATESISLYSSTEDAKEGIRAFFEKREPMWE
ncbi:enoyl-CoA hydratase-related protein [Archaeoglobus fulgidus]|uniref:Enoyl-CoA hydratase domain-containing protein 3, mitochondrial n=3 Tax=Archaeoglobus fulgidus TaxID=2234 RepID=O28632_ARCFU|nr:enoyl-CoA hydratase-related protein [Archaeoglobus fulgidus]AAB89601.1 enoyl-CoA hydratase (fad-4) [Archaeoglobus fulgidus DSM 4304]AIG98644.1 Enoyl-CoA hydratase/carnithine racemase [Archaeoglobus fulgidus DSM 8774]KUJ93017.1 MAG: Enoyl-CoA hydratase (Fad-4) [Archaeoglobus fulgidus]KUK05825.1 MAG: Enoyl-CoA hydratase (Fad-4) [Archaeoglobus fulgidus]